MKIIQYKGWKFHNLPKKLVSKDYMNLRNKVINDSKTFDNISVFLLGKSTDTFSLGFSDQDFVIVSEEPDEDIKKIFHPDNYEGNMKEVMFHEDVFFPRHLAKKFDYMDGRETIWTHLLGDDVDKLPPEKDMQLLRRIDDVVLHLSRRIYSYYLKRDIHVRHLGHCINGIKYYKSIVSSHNLKKRINDFSDSVIKLRNSWHQNDLENNLDILIYLLEESVNIIDNLLSDMSKKFSHNVQGNTRPGFIFSEEFPVLFKDSKNYFEETKSIYEKTGYLIPVVPENFFSLFAEYRKYEGPVSDYLRKNSSECSFSLNEKYRKYAEERIEFFNEHARYCKKYSLGYGPLVCFNQHYNYKTFSLIKKKIKKYNEGKKLKQILVSNISKS